MKLTSAILCFRFGQSYNDPMLFISTTSRALGCVLLLLYVDDVLVIGWFRAALDYLHHQFEIKNLGIICYFLGLEVSSSQCGYVLSQ